MNSNQTNLFGNTNHIVSSYLASSMFLLESKVIQSIVRYTDNSMSIMERKSSRLYGSAISKPDSMSIMERKSSRLYGSAISKPDRKLEMNGSLQFLGILL
jgi:hypothetical protein